jgi:aminoglycoside 3-N-acetyltransferase
MEDEAVTRSTAPASRDSLCRDLRALGVEPGMALIVHSSMSRLGCVAGGAHAVVLALLDAVGGTGTLVMPAHSTQLTDPASWRNPPVPEDWWEAVRDTLPAFDPLLTPTRGMGAVVECFRHVPGARRSAHPHHSFAAWGRRAEEVVADHALEGGLGERSPLARVYDIGGWVLLLGVGNENNTSFHLAEYRSDYPGKALVTVGAPVMVDGERRWVLLQELALNSDDFGEIGRAFAAIPGMVRRGSVGSGEALLMPQRAAVDFATGWIREHRGG